MDPHSRLAFVVHRLMARSGSGHLGRRLWRGVYLLVARAAVAFLIRDERAAAGYVRGGLAADLIPGYSDIDLAIVVDDHPDSGREPADLTMPRWLRLRSHAPVELLLDWPRVYGEIELQDMCGATALTFGLDRIEQSSDALLPRWATYLGPRARLDRVRALERPGLDGIGADWKRLTGPERRPRGMADPDPDRDPDLIAAWLELLYWWRWVFPVCRRPGAPRSAAACVKLVAEPARVWLRIVRGERLGSRRAALLKAREALPEEGAAIELALQVQKSLHRSQVAPLEALLPATVGLSARIADAIVSALGPLGTTSVRLVDGDAGKGAGSTEGRYLPLADWRGVVCPPRPDEFFCLATGDPGDPSNLAELAGVDGPTYSALLGSGLMVLPALRHIRTRMRAIKSAFSDPVSFALASGDDVASFPEAPGWSARDWARRAVTEHRALLFSGGETPGKSDRMHELGALLSAARAGLLLESLAEGDPILPLTVEATARELARRSASDAVEEGAGRYLELVAGGGEHVAPGLISALRGVITSTPAYARTDSGP